MNFIFYPSNHKLYKPGILLDNESGFISVSDIHITEMENHDLSCNADTIEILKGIPRILTEPELVLRLLTSPDSRCLLYNIHQDYKTQKELYNRILDISVYTGKFVIDEFTGHQPMLVLESGDTEYICLKEIIFSPTLKPIYDIRHINIDSAIIDKTDALLWLWANNNIRQYAEQQPNPYKFILELLTNI